MVCEKNMSEQPAPKSPLVNIAVSIMAAIDCCRSRDTITTNTVSNSGNTINETTGQDVPIVTLEEP